MEKKQEPETVSRAEFDRLRLEMTAERLLAEAGAKNLTAAKALLDWQAVDLQTADWQEVLRRQVQELRRGGETAFLFAHDWQGKDCAWLGLEPAAAGDPEDLEDGEGGFAFRLAQAGAGLESIKIKQEAAANGVIL